ncbi:MAG: response regulator [Fidelibacterota bacterium]
MSLSSLQKKPKADTRLLVVDDDLPIRRLLKKLLESAGYQVTVAEGGRQALEAIDSQAPFDTVILDIMMPDLSGLEVCSRSVPTNRDFRYPSDLTHRDRNDKAI